jgi:hypothetical protein
MGDTITVMGRLSLEKGEKEREKKKTVLSGHWENMGFLSWF